MKEEIQRMLVALNNEFYQANAESFSATRASAWTGWQRCAVLIGEACTEEKLGVIDVACGNMRFEHFLLQALPDKLISFFTTDKCNALVPDNLPHANVIYLEMDIAQELLDDNDPLRDVELRDVSVCFGFMHHLPGEALRAKLLRHIIEHTKPGGLVMVSLWRFMDVPALAEKAKSALNAAQADENLPEQLRAALPQMASQNDYLLGWQDTNTWRYCHSFSDADISALIESVADRATLAERFRADGHTGDANEYLVFKRMS